MNDLKLLFVAGCAPGDQVDALLTALTALTALSKPNERCKVSRKAASPGESDDYRTLPVKEVVDAARATCTPLTEVDLELEARLRSGTVVVTALSFVGEEVDVYAPHRSLSGSVDLWVPASLPVFVCGRPCSFEAEAAALSLLPLLDAEDFLARLAGAEGSRFQTAVYSDLDELGFVPPVEMSGTCTRRIEEISRDLVVTWIHVYDGEPLATLARRHLEELLPRVAAAPLGAQVGLAADVSRAGEHQQREMAAAHERTNGWRLPYAPRRFPRPRLPGDVMLTREQVLAVIATKPSTLLEALEGAAVPDQAWRNAESEAKEILALDQALLQGEVDFLSGRHKRWIEQHAPFHVQRTPNGGVMLTTHPYRTLWPLWAKALALLGIREADA